MYDECRGRRLLLHLDHRIGIGLSLGDRRLPLRLHIRRRRGLLLRLGVGRFGDRTLFITLLGIRHLGRRGKGRAGLRVHGGAVFV